MSFRKLKRKYNNSLILRKLRKRSCSKISKKCTVDKSTILEGRNKIGVANISSTKIGFGSYILSGNLSNCNIGRFCSIGNNVKVINSNHPINFVSSYPGFYKTINKDIFRAENNIEFEEFKLCENGKSVNIGNDVWIGDDVTILGGVNIGDGAVIGACALVTKDVPSYAVVGGIPAAIIKYRFSESVIEKLLKVKWWDWNLEKIKAKSIDFSDVEKFINNN